MLWTLVSKEPPAPAHGTRDTGQGRGQKAGLSLNWAVPNVLVKDVPNFEQLSPELEAGTARSSRLAPPQAPALGVTLHRGPGPWGRSGLEEGGTLGSC